MSPPCSSNGNSASEKLSESESPGDIVHLPTLGSRFRNPVMEAGKGIIDLEGTDRGYRDCGITLKRRCIRCLELSDKITESDEKCQLLESEIARKKSALESLEDKLDFVDLENTKLEYEVTVLLQKKKVLENIIRGREKEDDNLTQLMIKNKVLECEKKRAETKISNWKLKYQELEMEVLRMKSGGPTLTQTQVKPKEDEHGSGTSRGTSRINTPSMKHTHFGGFKGGHEFDLKPSFDFSGKDAPIVIGESDDDNDNDLCNSKCALKISSSVGLGVGQGKKDTHATFVKDHNSDEEEPFCYKKRSVRRKDTRVVTSESESNSDDYSNLYG